jgi:hypothetical protein
MDWLSNQIWLLRNFFVIGYSEVVEKPLSH